MRRSLVTIIATVTVVLAVLAGGIWLGGHPDRLPDSVRTALVGDEQAQLVREVMREVEEDYYRDIPDEELTNASIDGIVESLDDRFSHYFTPKEFRRYLRDSHAQYAGVGIEVREHPKGLKVMRLYDDSPAKKADVETGDLIVEADGRSLEGLSSETSTALIRGEPGTEVKLVLERDGERIPQTLERALVSVPVVASRMVETKNGTKVAHVVLATFSSGAHGELRREIDRRLEQGAEGIILDLRHNGGGLLEEARLVASIFIEEGEIVSIRGRSQPEKTLNATGGAIDSDIPVAVLVDSATASAAEIVAGAIQDRGRGRVVGERTFGKGVFQQVKPLSNGGALDITVGEYFLPSGETLGGGGVKPGAGLEPDVKAQDDPDTQRVDEAVRESLATLATRL